MPDNFGIHNWIDCLPTEIREIVHGCMRKRQLAPEEVLFHSGEVAEALYQVVKGEIECSIVSPEGKELILYISYPGDCFGDACLLTGSPRFYTASARHASEALVLPAGQFARLRGKHPEINHALLHTQSMRLQIMSTRMGTYASQSLRQVILQRLVFLSENGRRQDCGGVLIQTGLSQKEFGKLFGASRQSVNKELKVLQDENLIELRKNGILVCSMEGLSKAALTGA